MLEDPAQPKTQTPQEPPDSGANNPSSGDTPSEPTQPPTPAEGHPAYSGQEPVDGQSDTPKDQAPPQITQIPSDTGSSVIPPIITPPSPTRSRAKVVGSILALIILLIGIPTGVFLVRQSQEIRERAYETCGVNPDDETCYCDGKTVDFSVCEAMVAISCSARAGEVSCTNNSDTLTVEDVVIEWFSETCDKDGGDIDGYCEGPTQSVTVTLEPGQTERHVGLVPPSCGSWQTDILAKPGDCSASLADDKFPGCEYDNAAAHGSDKSGCKQEPPPPPPAQCTQGACGGEGKRCCSGLDDAKLCGGFNDNSKCKDGLTCQDNVCKKPPAPPPAVACACGGLGQECCDNRDAAHDAYKCGNKDGSRCVAGVCTGGVCRQPVGRPPGDRDEPAPITAECRNIKAYNENWQELNPTQRAQLKPGDTVRFAVGGTASQGTLERARFSINDADWQETISKNPFGEYFITPYTIKPGDTTIKVKAQLRHSNPDIGWF